MLKFRCQHCGQRIAVGARHLGKLVTCPECGQPTHPLAEQIVSLQSPQSSPPAVVAGATTAARPVSPRSERESPAKPRATAEPEGRCANCGDLIGRLQKRNLWQDHVVCTPCHAKLSGEVASAAPEAPKAQRVAARRAPRESEAPGAPGAADAAAMVPVLAKGAATAGRLALAGAWAVGALVKSSSASTTPGAAPAGSESAPDPDLPAPTRPSQLPAPTSVRASVRADEPGELATLDARRSPPTGLPLHTRLMIVLALICLAGAGVYVALSLLRELTGYLTAAAFLLLAIAGGYIAVRLSLLASRRFFPLRGAGRAGPAATTGTTVRDTGD